MGVHALGSRNWSHGLKNGCRRAGGFSHVSSFAEHLRDERNHHSADEAAAEKKVD
jgi:hypothetical protein